MSTTEHRVDLDRRSIDTIRTLAMDAVQKANSGHPGTPMALAPVAYLLYARVMKHNPRDPSWPDRDRFVLSAGHASMLQYAALHLSGYDLSLEDLEQFRQWGSRTPGHPEHDRVHATPGVETTTGPLGQGFANGVGMALAERFLRERYGAEVQDHQVWGICSDGDLMEGIASEAASIAGHLALGKLVYLYDDNTITIDGHTDISFAGEDVSKRFEAYGWHVIELGDVNEDLDALEQALRAGADERERPTLIHAHSTIAWPAPNAQNTSKAHGAALGEDEVRATKEALGLDPDQHFFVPDGVYEHCSAVARGEAEQAAWRERFEAWRAADAARAEEWDAAWAGRPVKPIGPALPAFDPADAKAISTRAAGGKAMAAFEPLVPTMLGGAADLVASTMTQFPASGSYSAQEAGRNIHWGIREHAMAGAVNGMALHGGIVRPYGSSFLIFSDYMRNSIRLSALMGIPTAWVFSHDSVALGEDGPTHQPIEQLASLRAIPGLTVIRPGDAAETAEAWRVILEDLEGPAVLALSRQNLRVLDRGDGGAFAEAAGLARGAYVLREADGGPARAAIVATGGEVEVALAAQEQLAGEGIPVRVVSMPSWELFEAEDRSYRESILPADLPKVSVEAASSFGWSRWVDASVAIDRFGASAPGTTVLRELGITPEVTAAQVKALL